MASEDNSSIGVQQVCGIPSAEFELSEIKGPRLSDELLAEMGFR